MPILTHAEADLPATMPAEVVRPQRPGEALGTSHAAKRESILDAAASVFCREGYGGANLDMVAVKAGVSRQTIYNHHHDKQHLFLAVVRAMTERVNADIFDTLDTFPDRPSDLAADLTAFAVRMTRDCVCSREGNFIRKLVQNEGERYPELFAAWLKEGPLRTRAALAARFARLALAGHLSPTDPDLAACQFLALVRAELEPQMLLGQAPSDDELENAVAAGVATFLRAYATPAGA